MIMDDKDLLDTLQRIKDKFFSNNNMPKLVLGSGLSISYGIQGMSELKEHLNSRMPLLLKGDTENLSKWAEISEKLKTTDLENSLSGLESNNNQKLIKYITSETASLLIQSMREKMYDIFAKETGFKKILGFLSKSCSSNNTVLDIMTSNYDLLIELVADSLKIHCIDGFEGNIFKQFNEPVLETPNLKYKTSGVMNYIRLFKPHGSLNWVKYDNDLLKSNDINFLQNNIDRICIVAPGGAKYQASLTERYFRIPRELFSRSISKDPRTPLIIHGYGFNDDHFNALLLDELSRPLLVISKGVSNDILLRLEQSIENVAIYYDYESSSNKLLYRSKTYTINEDLWNLNIFADKIIA